ncbi:oxidoreductase [Nocardia stercoris]|uniref:oxidoreductase n=1 Tax=Nocardia stercoris TaxID=2483361 RepID=UPI0011C48872|nr:oxidoreductase [Nocardia stercoris]
MAFDLPGVTTALGMASLLGAAAVHLYLLGTETGLPGYLTAYFVVLSAGWIFAAVMMALGRFADRGWLLAGLVSAVFLVGYVLSRLTGLPGLPAVKYRWDFTPGTVALLCAALFLAVWVSVLLGINVAHPRKRDWHD